MSFDRPFGQAIWTEETEEHPHCTDLALAVDNECMGLTTQVVTVRPSRGSRRKINVEFLVDSGAVYSLAPGLVLRRLGLRPYRTEIFSLADATKVKRKVGD